MFTISEALWGISETNEADLIVTQTCTIHWRKEKRRMKRQDLFPAGKMRKTKRASDTGDHLFPRKIIARRMHWDGMGTISSRDIEFDFKEILENTNWDQFQR